MAQIRVIIEGSSQDGQLEISEKMMFPYLQIATSVHKFYKQIGMKNPKKVYFKGSSVARLFVPMIIPNDYDITTRNITFIYDFLKDIEKREFVLDEERTLIFEKLIKPANDDYETLVIKAKLRVEEDGVKYCFPIDFVDDTLMDIDFLFNGLKFAWYFEREERVEDKPDGTKEHSFDCIAFIYGWIANFDDLAKVKLGLHTTYHLMDKNAIKYDKSTVSIDFGHRKKFGMYMKRLKKTLRRDIKVRGVRQFRSGCCCKCRGLLAKYYFEEVEFWGTGKEPKCIECQLAEVADEKSKYPRNTLDINIGQFAIIESKRMFDIFSNMRSIPKVKTK
jgi:hypothetical protein